ncbi:MAG: sulfite exporter TauE/SafE family protein [Candidatus Methylacidiphilaceae bacterium]
MRDLGFPDPGRADDKKWLARLDPVNPAPYLLPMHILGLALLGLLAGFASGCFGIGGGSLLVPVLVLSFAVPYHIAVGTSLALILPIALAGSLANWTLKQIDWSVFTVIALSGAAGAALGSFFIQAIPAVYAKRAFAVFLLYAAYRLWR